MAVAPLTRLPASAQPSRMPRSHRLRAATVGMLALALAAAALGVVNAAFSGRPQPPDERRYAARSAVARARLGPALRWAPDELAKAATALAGAEIDYGRQSGRLWPLRDFTPVAARLWSAEVGARAAHRLGEARRIAALGEAEDVLEDTAGLLRVAEMLAKKTSLPSEDRVRLARTRLALSEARALLARQEYVRAHRSAERGRVELERALGPALERARRFASTERVRTWTRWTEETREWSRATGRVAILVLKEKNRLVLLDRGRAVRAYLADIGSDALGRKLRAGDRATPEGRYRVVAKKGRGRSEYHKALLLDYPNEEDRHRTAEARRRGEVPAGSTPGRLIEIHGEGGRGTNWTDGCVAVSNADMDELFAKAEVGSRVTIVGGDGADGVFSGLVRRLSADGRWP
jgi:hypothetical protein